MYCLIWNLPDIIFIGLIYFWYLASAYKNRFFKVIGHRSLQTGDHKCDQVNFITDQVIIYQLLW